MTLWFKSRIFLAAGLVFVADRLTKYFIIKSITPGQSIKVIPDVFHITLVFNNGAAFGVLQNCALFFIIFSFAAIALMLLIIYKAHQLDTLLAVSLALILGGAAGNLVDRLKFGYVIDFLDFRIWPVFNIADSCISIGIALIAFSFIFKKSG
ncbi:MAG: signal peptidase II [Candidatus Omnitrophica bacterium]|nr:signal peptidase II [Candidatus Omnitrophota bacterium]